MKPKRTLVLLLTTAAATAGAVLPGCHTTPQHPAAGTVATTAPATTTPAAPPPAAQSQTSTADDDDKPRPISRVTLANGLLVEDLVIGAGSLCAGGDVTVTVRYTGTLADGEVFDGTRSGEAADLPLERLITGWKDGVPGMRVGGMRRLTVPAPLAYGGRGLKDGARVVVPPDAELTFEIELLGVR